MSRYKNARSRMIGISAIHGIPAQFKAIYHRFFFETINFIQR
jgi:hypothetical protein